jgi:protein phosphatase
VPSIVCEEKHMGSRAVVIVCRDESAALRRFAVSGDGIAVTRTGRRFFEDSKLEAEFLAIVRAGMTRAGLWDELKTDWICLDCELMPWSAKAQELLRQQYAAVGAAASHALPVAVEMLRAASQQVEGLGPLLGSFGERLGMANLFVDAYRRYCWKVESIADYKLAPFHIMATEGATHTSKNHLWHMQTLKRLAEACDGLVIATGHLEVDLTDEKSLASGVAWWEELTGRGGEGMV